MALSIAIKSPTFSAIAQEVFSILNDTVNVTHVEIEKRKLTFRQAPGDIDLTLTVKTREALGRLEIIAFLVSPGITYFGSEGWLNTQFDQYPKRLAIYNSDDSPTVDALRSK